MCTRRSGSSALATAVGGSQRSDSRPTVARRPTSRATAGSPPARQAACRLGSSMCETTSWSRRMSFSKTLISSRTRSQPLSASTAISPSNNATISFQANRMPM